MNLYDEIQRLAYELYERSGCVPGRCLDNWLEAERIVLTEIVVVGEPSDEASAARTRRKRTVKPQTKKTEKKAAGTAKKGATSAAKGRAKKKT